MITELPQLALADAERAYNATADAAECGDVEALTRLPELEQRLDDARRQVQRANAAAAGRLERERQEREAATRAAAAQAAEQRREAEAKYTRLADELRADVVEWVATYQSLEAKAHELARIGLALGTPPPSGAGLVAAIAQIGTLLPLTFGEPLGNSVRPAVTPAVPDHWVPRRFEPQGPDVAYIDLNADGPRVLLRQGA